MAKCCVVFIYGLDRKSRWTVVTLTLTFGGKVLCCIHIWFRQEIQIDYCDFDFMIWWQSVVRDTPPCYGNTRVKLK